MNKIALYVASILTLQSTPLTPFSSAHAQQQKVSRTSEQKETSFLEQLIDKLEITTSPKEKQKIIKGYNPKRDYQSKYQEIVKQIWNLPIVQYKNTHFLSNNKNTYELGNIRIQLDETYFDSKNNAIIPKDKPSIDLLLKYDLLEHQHYDPLQKKVVKEDRIIKEFQSILEATCQTPTTCTYNVNILQNIKTEVNQKEKLNQVYYLATYLTTPIITDLEKRNTTWLAKPWKQPKAEYKTKEPIDQNTGEFIFYGEDWCKPCHEIADYLFEEKIPFQEKNQKDTETQCKGQVPYILQENTCGPIGKPIIMDLIKKIY